MNRYKRKQAIAKAKKQAQYQAMTDRYNRFYKTDLSVFDFLRMHGVNEGSMFDIRFNCKLPQYYMDPVVKLSPKLQAIRDSWLKELAK